MTLLTEAADALDSLAAMKDEVTFADMTDLARQLREREAKAEGLDAARDVLAERARQVSVEGWTPEHDDEHDPGEIAAAATAYAMAATDALHPFTQGDGNYENEPPSCWMWDATWWKPGDPRRMLVKAGALIIAEIERLDRLSTRAIKIANAHVSADDIAIQAMEEGIAAVAGQAEWRCFHCDETFTDEASAREHFGPSLGSEPACAIDIAKYREMEETLARWIAQGGTDDEHAREIAAIRLDNEHRNALQREREKGYAKGLADGRALGVAVPSAKEEL